MQRATPRGGGTFTSAAPRSGTSVQPSRRAAGAGESAVRPGDGGEIALAGIVEWPRARAAACPVPARVTDRVDTAFAAGPAGAPRGGGAPPLEALRPHLPVGFVLGISVGSPDEAEHAPATADYWSV